MHERETEKRDCTVDDPATSDADRETAITGMLNIIKLIKAQYPALKPERVDAVTYPGFAADYARIESKYWNVGWLVSSMLPHPFIVV
ncbi:MAG: hypothetical protein HQM09_23435 [Candidatus Riflebacteria bacterium]|nr:hypothetical protein [Candidatus Riflebacteria bacterium]